MTRSLIGVALLFAFACSSTSTSDDAGPGDGGASDAGVLDAGSTDAGAPDAGVSDAGIADGGINCSGSGATFFPTFDRTCQGDSDCTIGMHQTDCCGSVDATGIASSAQSAFSAAEATCEGMYPGCGCASGRVTADDGAMPVGSGEGAIVVHCVSNLCTTSVRAPTACDSATCTSSQVCVKECTGVPLPPDAGPLPSKCVDVPPACATSTSCSCFGTTDPCPTGQCISVQNGAPICECA